MVESVHSKVHVRLATQRLDNITYMWNESQRGHVIFGNSRLLWHVTSPWSLKVTTSTATCLLHLLVPDTTRRLSVRTSSVCRPSEACSLNLISRFRTRVTTTTTTTTPHGDRQQTDLTVPTFVCLENWHIIQIHCVEFLSGWWRRFPGVTTSPCLKDHTCHEVHEWMSLLHNSLKILPLIWRVNFRWRLTHSCGHFLHFGLFVPKISISANHWYVTFLHVIDPHCIHTTLHVHTLTSISVGGGSDGDVGSEKAVSTVREHVCTHTCTEWRLYLET